MVQSAIQTTHSNSVTKSRKPDITSPLDALASVLVEMLEDDDHETIPSPIHEIFSTLVQYLGPEIQILTVDIEVPSKEMNPSQEPKKPVEPSTQHQPMIDQLTQSISLN